MNGLSQFCQFARDSQAPLVERTPAIPFSVIVFGKPERLSVLKERVGLSQSFSLWRANRVLPKSGQATYIVNDGRFHRGTACPYQVHAVHKHVCVELSELFANPVKFVQDVFDQLPMEFASEARTYVCIRVACKVLTVRIFLPGAEAALPEVGRYCGLRPPSVLLVHPY